MTQVYAPPALAPLGSLRSLTKGAGPGGTPIVMQTIIIEPFVPTQRDAYERPAIVPLGSLASLTRGAGPEGELLVMATGGGIPGGGGLPGVGFAPVMV